MSEMSNAGPADPFDPASLRLEAAVLSSLGTKKHITTIPVKKPNKQAFIRVHPDEKFRLLTSIIEMKESNENFLVARELRDALVAEVDVATLFTAMDRQGTLFLWPIK